MARLCLNLQPLTQQLVFVNRWNSVGSSCKEVFILVFFVTGVRWERGDLAQGAGFVVHSGVTRFMIGRLFGNVAFCTWSPHFL